MKSFIINMYRLVIGLVFLTIVFGGKVPPHLDGRIIGGEATTIEEFPYQISLRYLDEHVCGGSIINANTVITAAHCTDEKSVKYLEVSSGSAAVDAGRQIVKIKELIQHERFDSNTYDNDVAILKLAEPLTLDETRAPISLQNTDVPPKTKAVVSGWGLLEAGSHDKPDILHKVEVNVVSSEECNADYKGQITQAMLCANAPGKDACQGDSGGPLVANGKLIGIVSWGEGCADPTHPGVYSKVSYLLPWINQHL